MNHNNWKDKIAGVAEMANLLVEHKDILSYILLFVLIDMPEEYEI